MLTGGRLTSFQNFLRLAVLATVSVYFVAGSDFARASGADPCADLNAFACDPTRDVSDGTESHKPLTSEEIDQKVREAYQSSGLRANDYAEKILSEASKDSYLDFHVFKASGLDLNERYKNCFDDESRPIGKNPLCKLAVANALGTILKAQLFEFLPTQFPEAEVSRVAQVLDDPAAQKYLKEFTKQLERKVLTEEQRALVAAQFDEVRKTFSDLLDDMDLDPFIKAQMKTKLSTMTLQQSCAELPLPFAPNAFYDRSKNLLAYCPSLTLKQDSLFSMISTMAHEMGHAFDRCLLQKKTTIQSVAASKYTPQLVSTLDSGHPFAALSQCLRSPDSVNARMCGAEMLKCNFGDTRTREACALKQKTKPLFNACGEKDTTSTEDQVTEATADWFSAEALPRILSRQKRNLTQDQWRNGVGNILSALCDSEESVAASEASLNRRVLPCDSHPKTAARVNGIYGVQPLLRAKMGCSKPLEKRYCPINGVELNGTSPGVQQMNSKSRSVRSAQ